jgi:hypothetical protein
VTLVEITWSDGRRERTEVGAEYALAETLIVPVPVRLGLADCWCVGCRWRRVRFRREIVAVPEGMHGPFESHVLLDEETGRRWMVRYREELPS